MLFIKAAILKMVTFNGRSRELHIRESHRRGSLARFTNLKNKGLLFKDKKNSFSRSAKINGLDTLYNDIFLH